MSEKVAVVRLRAVVDQYLSAIGRAEKATKGLTDTERFKKLGTHMESVGGSLTRHVTLPLLAVGAAAVKMSIDFNKSFARMMGLAGVAADEVDGLKKAVLDLAEETGRGPQELAEGLYFVRSAGIAGKAALETLEVSAKGAAAGLGETASIADAVTSALGAYGEEAITAAEAGDVLAATAREGKAEASALAPQFGRLLPIAAQLGVRFDEVGAGLAYMSRQGGGAELAATNMQNVLMKLLNPAEEGVKALEAMGMSTKDLRESIKEQGLLSTLVMLRDSLEANGMELGDFSRDAQFTVGALALTADEGERAREVFDALADSSGSLQEAFDAAAGRDGFKMEQALARLQSALIQIGDIIVPVAADIAESIAAVAGAFSSLPDPVQKAIVMLGGLALVAGPLISVGGKLMKAWSTAGDVLGLLGQKAGIGSAGLSKVGRAAGIAAKGAGVLLAAYIGLEYFANSRANKVGKELEGMFPDLDATNLTDVKKAIQGYKRELDALDDREGKGRIVSVFGANIFATSGDADRNEKIGQTREKIAALEEQERSLTDAQLNAAGSSREQAEALGLNADAAADAAKELQGYIDKLTAVFDPIFGMQDALAGEAEARKALNEAIKEHGTSSAEAAEAEDALFRAIVSTDQAAIALKASMDAGGTSMETAAGYLDDWVESGRLTREQADRIAERIGIATSTAEGFAGTYTATVVANTGDAEAAIARLKASIAAVPKTVAVDFVGPLLPGQRATGPATGTGKRSGGKARGGWSPAGGLQWAGENGPELVGTGDSAYFLESAASSRLVGASAPGAGGDVIVNLHVAGSVHSKESLAAEVKHVIAKGVRNDAAFAETVRGGR